MCPDDYFTRTFWVLVQCAIGRFWGPKSALCLLTCDILAPTPNPKTGTLFALGLFIFGRFERQRVHFTKWSLVNIKF